MLNNNIFKLFFDYRGTLTRREYWAGLIFLFMLLFFNISNYNTNKATDSILVNFFYMNNEDLDAFSISSINSYIDNILEVYLPISFFTLYCSIVITLKRSRLFTKNSFAGVFGGIILYLLLAIILFSVIFITNKTGNSSIDSSSAFILFGKIVFLSTALLIILNIFVIIRLSKTTIKDKIPTNNNKHATVGTLYSIGKLILGLFSSLLILGIFLIINSDSKSSEYNLIYENISNLIYIIGAVVFIYILVKRASDARLESNKIYIPLLCYIFFYFITLILPSIYNGFVSEFMLIYKALAIGMHYANIASIIGIFLLIGLPSKR